MSLRCGGGTVPRATRGTQRCHGRKRRCVWTVAAGAVAPLLVAVPEAGGEAVDPAPPVLGNLTVAAAAELVGLVERNTHPVREYQAVGIVDRVTLVTPARCRAMIERDDVQFAKFTLR